MKVFLITVEDVPVETKPGIFEEVVLKGLVAAENKNQAWSYFCSNNASGKKLVFASRHRAKTILRHTTEPAGVLPNDSPIWCEVGKELPDSRSLPSEEWAQRIKDLNTMTMREFSVAYSISYGYVRNLKARLRREGQLNG